MYGWRPCCGQTYPRADVLVTAHRVLFHRSWRLRPCHKWFYELTDETQLNCLYFYLDSNDRTRWQFCIWDSSANLSPDWINAAHTNATGNIFIGFELWARKRFVKCVPGRCLDLSYGGFDYLWILSFAKERSNINQPTVGLHQITFKDFIHNFHTRRINQYIHMHPNPYHITNVRIRHC